jgi:hypothetical protein
MQRQSSVDASREREMKPVQFVLTSLVLACGVCACSHGPSLSTEDRLALYREHSGEPVGAFRLDRTLGTRNWTPLGDQALAVWQSSNTGFLLELRSRCTGLSTASRIAITNLGGQVSARTDRVVPGTVGGARPGLASCRIEIIRPIDGSALREAKRELRDAEYLEREAAPPEETPSP